MANHNGVTLIGRLTRDPEKRVTPNGASVAQLGLAINERWTGKDGEKNERTVFVDVTCWGKLADNCAEYLSKGREVFIQGRLSLDQWKDKESGANRQKLYVTANIVQFLNAGANGNKPTATEGKSQTPAEVEEEVGF